MEKLNLYIKNFSKTIKRLEEALALPATAIYKDAAVHRFEFCFELGWKTIKLYLAEQGTACSSPKDCFRKGADAGLIEDPEVWFGYLDARNLVAHVYNEKIANQIYAAAKNFPAEARKLAENLKKNN